jgi:hypothetical protein
MELLTITFNKEMKSCETLHRFSASKTILETGLQIYELIRRERQEIRWIYLNTKKKETFVNDSLHY